MNKIDSKLFIKSISLNEDIEPHLFEEYPLNICALRFFASLKFVSPVTIFIGANGCGKSTIIEAIASNIGIPITGGNKIIGAIVENYTIGEEKESALAQYLRCDKGYKRPRHTFFFRAESFYKLADIIDHDSIRSRQRDHVSTIDVLNYADKELLNQSHGESFMDFMKHQFSEDSLFILDEPESALSPDNQIKLLGLIDYYSKRGTQFIIATHSPLILGYKNAKIISLDNGMKEVKYKDTKVYKMYKDFLDDPEGYQMDFEE